MNFALFALAAAHASVQGAAPPAEDQSIYLTDESGLLLTDPEGNLIALG